MAADWPMGVEGAAHDAVFDAANMANAPPAGFGKAFFSATSRGLSKADARLTATPLAAEGVNAKVAVLAAAGAALLNAGVVAC